MSGWEVCRKIRQEPALAHTGVLMLTGIGESLNETTSPLFGADEYIDKPFDFAELRREVASRCSRSMRGRGKPCVDRDRTERRVVDPTSPSEGGDTGVGHASDESRVMSAVNKVCDRRCDLVADRRIYGAVRAEVCLTLGARSGVDQRPIASSRSGRANETNGRKRRRTWLRKSAPQKASNVLRQVRSAPLQSLRPRRRKARLAE